MKKKTLFIILINIVSIFLIIFAAELYIYNFLYDNKEKGRYFPDYSLNSCILPAENYGRNFYHEEYKKPPIWLMGCSYAYGYLLENKNTLGEKLSNYSKRPVYNWAWCGIGPAEALIKLFTDKNEKFLPKSPPEYVIYVYMYNHISRYPRNYNVLYALKELDVIKNTNIPFDKLYTVKYVKQRLFNQKMDFSKDSNKEIFMTQMFVTMKKEVEKKYPNTKFVILIYNDSNNNVSESYELITDYEYSLLNSKEYWKNLQDKGFNVIWTKDLTGREMDSEEYRIKNDPTQSQHPTSQAWDLIVPKLVKKLNL